MKNNTYAFTVIVLLCLKLGISLKRRHFCFNGISLLANFLPVAPSAASITPVIGIHCMAGIVKPETAHA